MSITFGGAALIDIIEELNAAYQEELDTDKTLLGFDGADILIRLGNQPEERLGGLNFPGEPGTTLFGDFNGVVYAGDSSSLNRVAAIEATTRYEMFVSNGSIWLEGR